MGIENLLFDIFGGFLDFGLNQAGILGAEGRQSDRVENAAGSFQDATSGFTGQSTNDLFGLNALGFNTAVTPSSALKSTTNFDELLRKTLDELSGGKDAATGVLRGGVEQLGRLFDKAVGGLQGERVDPLLRARQVGDFLPDAPLIETLNSNLRGIGDASRARGEQATQNAAASALSSGGSLQQAQSGQDLASLRENRSRSLQVGQARASTEQQLNQRQQTRAGFQSAALRDRDALNNALAMAEADIRGKQAGSFSDFLGSEADRASRLGELRASATEQSGFAADAAQDRDQTQEQDLLQRGVDNLFRGRAFDRDTLLAIESAIFGGRTGVDTLFQPSNIFGNAFSNQNARDIAEANAPKSSGFGFSLVFEYSRCIEDTAVVETERGEIPLRDVLSDDRVRGEDGEMHRVVAKDHGFVPEDERTEHVTIRAGGHEITATVDHVIEGVPAGEWVYGDNILVNGEGVIVDEIMPAEYVISGDLMLEGNVPYIANGFIVESVIGQDGLDRWREHIESRTSFELDGYVHDEQNPTGGFAMMELVEA